MANANIAAGTTATDTSSQICLSREAYDVVIAMQLGLGSNRIAKGLGISHAAVLSRQNTLEKLGVISGGTMDGTRRQILLAHSQFQVAPEHVGTVKARNVAQRELAEAAQAEADRRAAIRETRIANLAKGRKVKVLTEELVAV